MTENIEVIVIGGGYAGVMAANRLSRRDDVRVTVVNPRPHFVARIRLHQLVGGSDDAVVDYATVLTERARLVVDSVAWIDAAERRVVLTTGGALPYDHLVYAVGSGSDVRGVPGAAEYALPLATLEEAERLRAALAAEPAAAPVTVVGGGPLGIEAAAELAELGRTVTLVCGDELGPDLHPRGRQSVARRLSGLGVVVLDGAGAAVTAVTRDSVRLRDGRDLPSTVTVWAAGFGVPDLAARSGLTTDSLGRLLTDETLTSVDDERIVAAGDAAAPSDLPYRMSCQGAVQLGPYAADTVLSRIEGKQPAPVALGFVSECISLGRRDAVFQSTRLDDTARGFHITGQLAAWLKELICTGTVKQLGLEARRPGLLRYPSWTRDHRRRQVLAGRETPAAG
ncbi:NAD(P)/FAD-dependent oxidoreductase [Pseudonocardia sp. CA-107938]|uniref:NAD(P)/FAD-dependent oxidoreductase n=1 Tax=Pseudonocardia sp. CA-107938 TaxID=3240021 RepID=UPI003D8E6A29